MLRSPVIGDLRVQEVVSGTGRVSYTILHDDGQVHRLADRFLRTCNGGTDRTYGYLLVDHLRWLEFEALTCEKVALRDLHRYMASIGAEYAGPIGRPWRPDRKPYGQRSLELTAACLKRFYLFQGSLGVHQELAKELDQTRLPTQADRRRMFLGHVARELPANPLTPDKVVRRKHPKLPAEGARAALLDHLPRARDRMTVTWLGDGGFRVGEFCGLHLMDLHLREHAECGDCRTAHVHICHREANANRSRAKSKHPWKVERGVVVGGLIRRVSPAIVHTYFEYMTTEYPTELAKHGMLLVQLKGPRRGEPLSTDAVRAVMGRAGNSLGLGRTNPHGWRHQFATTVLEVSDGNTVMARDAGGWASATTVEQIYGHTDLHDPKFMAALDRVWGES